jgi:small-conductance mechanosensitive channel
MKRLQSILLFWLLSLLWLGATPAAAQPSVQLRKDAVRVAEPATVEMWNRPILTLRASVGDLDPRARAEGVRQRIEALPYSTLSEKVQATSTRLGQLEGLMITVGTQPIIGILPEDLDPETGETLEQAGQRAVERLSEVLRARAEQRRLPVLLWGLGFSIVATLIFVLILWAIIRVSARLFRLIELRAQKRHLVVLSVDIQPTVHSLELGLLKLSTLIAVLIAAYLWLTFVLKQFPYSRPWGDRVGGYLGNLFYKLGSGALAAMPGLFTVLVIFALTRLVTRAVNRFFLRVEHGQLTVSWLTPDTAPATRKLVTTLIWIFAITVAYPYIPGSDSDAFKGVSVFVGLMVSLGSAGLVNQVMSGLVIIYSRAFKPGDYVRVSESEGIVSQVGLLSTKIATLWREEITVPNAVMVSNLITNYSRLAGAEGPVAHTSVTIGYDAPWRQIHALLLLAAERTPSLRREPRPWVLQRALNDFYVEYQLFVVLNRPEDRIPALSDLHAQIQDAFNEYGVQIMSPHFVGQPEQKVTVERSQWHAPPSDDNA